MLFRAFWPSRFLEQFSHILYPWLIRFYQDRWLLSRLTSTLETVSSHMDALSPHLAFAAIHQFLLADFCDTYVVGSLVLFCPNQWVFKETTKRSLWNADHPRLADISCTLRFVLLQSLKQLSVFMPFVSEFLFEQLKNAEDKGFYEETLEVWFSLQDS